MNFENLGNIGEFIAAIATLLTLIYLAYQIRQNTKSQQLVALNSATDSLIGMGDILLGSPDLFQIFYRGVEDIYSLDEGDRVKFNIFVYDLFLAMEKLFLLHQSGVLDQDVWEARSITIRGYFGRPGVQEWWQGRRDAFSNSFVQFLESNQSEHAFLPLAEVGKND